MPWAAIIPALISAGTAIYSANQSKKAASNAVDQQKSLAANLKYEPIDIEKLKADATASAIQNATNSLALERQLQPVVADTREQTNLVKQELARQVGADLKLGGNLSPDVINRVNTAGRVIGSTSGIGSPNTVPLSASLLGLSSIDLINQRRAAAANLAAPGPLPVAGLDPGAVASAEVAQNAAENQFNLKKAGVDQNLIDSEAEARTAQIGGQTGVISSLGNLAFGSQQPLSGGLFGAYTAAQKNKNALIAAGASGRNQNPATNPLMSSSPLGLA